MTSVTDPPRAAAVAQTAPARAMEILTEQANVYVGQLRALAAQQWAQRTECPDWDVREMAAHIAGALEEGARMRVMIRHMRAARKAPPPQVDALNAAQVADRRSRSGPEIADEIERLAPRAARARRRTPALIRRRPVPGGDLGPDATFSYLFDVIYPRDLYMHRIDTARAVGAALPACRSDAEIVEQVVRDLGRSWTGPAVTLELTGAGGGRWLLGDGRPQARASADAAGYCRLLSGRAAAGDTVTVDDDATGAALLAARIPF